MLDDVAQRARSTPATLGALARWVARGGALVVTGGPHLFGDPGFVESPLERAAAGRAAVAGAGAEGARADRALPRDRPLEQHGLLDQRAGVRATARRWSTRKRAALAVLDQLGPRDLVGAIAFDSQPYELGPLAPVGEGRRGARGSASARCATAAAPTSRRRSRSRAAQPRSSRTGRVRHIILLTDGDTNRRADDHATLIADLARAEISVTDHPHRLRHREPRAAAARSRAPTGGEFHHVENVHALPQLMIRDTQRLIDAAGSRRERAARARRSGADARRASPRRATARRALGDDAAQGRRRAAPLRRRRRAGATRCSPPGSTSSAASPSLPLDFQAGAAEWAAWRGFGKLWTQLVLWAAPTALADDRRLEVLRRPGGTLVRLQTVGDDPGPFSLRLAGREDVTLRPLGRRRFGAMLGDLEPGIHAARLQAGSHTETLELAVPPWGSGRETRGLTPDRALLARVAAATGGAVDAAPAAVVAARPGTRRERRPLATPLAALAIALVLADVALRRQLGPPATRARS